MDEDRLLEKLLRIEALYAGTTSEGEREAARQAAERIRSRLTDVREREPDVELVYTLPDPWNFCHATRARGDHRGRRMAWVRSIPSRIRSNSAASMTTRSDPVSQGRWKGSISSLLVTST